MVFVKSQAFDRREPENSGHFWKIWGILKIIGGADCLTCTLPYSFVAVAGYLSIKCLTFNLLTHWNLHAGRRITRNHANADHLANLSADFLLIADQLTGLRTPRVSWRSFWDEWRVQ